MSKRYMANLDWTGERYLPQVSGEIKLEHYHRYLLSKKFSVGKNVLDIACGEGYGSSQLAEVAASVVGVDISKEAVEHARACYPKDNLEFLQGSCSKIPLPDDSVDVVVSFETIEHHNEHEDMMHEIKRVLNQEGVLIISSPDKKEYSDIPQYKNEYHVKELYASEFARLLKNNFNNVMLLGQRIKSGSLIAPYNSSLSSNFFPFDEELNSSEIFVPLYLIAIASDTVSTPSLTSFYAASSQSKDSQIIELNKAVNSKDSQIIELNGAVNSKDSQVVELNSLVGMLREKLSSVERQDDHISVLTNSIAERDVEVDSLVSERDVAIQRLSEIKQSSSWLLSSPVRIIGHLLKGNSGIAANMCKESFRRPTQALLARVKRLQIYEQFLIKAKELPISKVNNSAISRIIEQRFAYTREAISNAPLSPVAVPELSKVDISIVTYNSSRWISDFTESLIGLDYPKNLITLYFVDNSSTDTTLEGLKSVIPRLMKEGFSVEVMERPNRGYGAGHNAALAKGVSPFCLISNIDLTFEPDALNLIMNIAMEDSEDVAAWELRQKPYEHPKYYDPVTGLTNWNSHACVLLRRKALEVVGQYDTSLFMYGEDVELSYRLRRDGFLLRYCPRAVVWHYTYENTNQVKPIQYLGSTYANLYLRLKYGKLTDILAVPFLGVRLLKDPEPFPGSRRAILRSLLKLLVMSPRALLSRRRSEAYFPFRNWDYELGREGAFIEQKGILNNPPLVSVITRTFRGREVYLRQALLSAAHQTYSNIEYVVVEDGGGSMRMVVDNISQKLGQKIHFIEQEKLGRSAAGNAGLAAAKGRWCLFLDDDDLLFADHIEILVNTLHAYPVAAAAYTLAWEVKTDKEKILSEGAYSEISHEVLPIMRQEFDHKVFWHHNFIPIQSVLFERRLFDERGGFELDMDALEDWVLWKKYAQGNQFHYVPKVTSMYRVPADPVDFERRMQVINDAYLTAVEKTDNTDLHIDEGR